MTISKFNEFNQDLLTADYEEIVSKLKDTNPIFLSPLRKDIAIMVFGYDKWRELANILDILEKAGCITYTTISVSDNIKNKEYIDKVFSDTSQQYEYQDQFTDYIVEVNSIIYDYP